MKRWIAHHSTVLAALAGMPDASFDAILSDVPYGLGSHQPTIVELLAYLGGAELDTGGDFMGRDWHVPSVHTWKEILRVLKPGGYVLTFGGPRTVDLVSLGLRAAGFEIRDVITYSWWFGTGFPKSQDASKALDAAAGVEREVVGIKPGHEGFADRATTGHVQSDADLGGEHRFSMGKTAAERYHQATAPATELAAAWEGYGTALKPAFEPIILARKPLIGTLAENIALHDTGALAINASRIATDWSERSEAWKRSGHSAKPDAEKIAAPAGNGVECHPGGRWPANVILDEGSAALLDALSGTGSTNEGGSRSSMGYGGASCERQPIPRPGDTGGASRFFYVTKASREERDLGCEHLPLRSAAEVTDSEEGAARLDSPRTGAGRTSGARNHHPTVKPVDLTRWLAGLLLPPPRDGVPRRLLVPYAGSGSEMIGAILAGWDMVEGIEREADFLPILRARVALAETNSRAFEPFADRKAAKVDARQCVLFGSRP